MNDSISTPNSKARLYAKVAAVMADVKRLEKRGTNAHFKYDFVTAEDVKDLIRPLLAKHQLALFPTIEGIEREPRDKGQTLTRLAVAFTLACGESGETVTSLWHGEALDNQDKGINKALTAVLKYYLINTFQVSTGDEADPDAGQVAPQGAAQGLLQQIVALYRDMRPDVEDDDITILNRLFDNVCGENSPFTQENAGRVLVVLASKRTKQQLQATNGNGHPEQAESVSEPATLLDQACLYVRERVAGLESDDARYKGAATVKQVASLKSLLQSLGFAGTDEELAGIVALLVRGLTIEEPLKRSEFDALYKLFTEERFACFVSDLQATPA